MLLTLYTYCKENLFTIACTINSTVMICTLRAKCLHIVPQIKQDAFLLVRLEV